MAFGRVAKAVASSSRHIAELNRPLMKYGGPRILEAKPKKVALSGPSGFIGNRVLQCILDIHEFRKANGEVPGEVVLLSSAPGTLMARLTSQNGRERMSTVRATRVDYYTMHDEDLWQDQLGSIGLGGEDSVFCNLAGIAGPVPGRPDAMKAVNYAAPLAAARACEALGFGHWIQSSTQATKAERAGQVPYSQWNSMADFSLARLERLPVTVLTIGMLFCKDQLIVGQRGDSLNLVDLATLPLTPVMGDGSAPLQPLDITDAAERIAYLGLSEPADRPIQRTVSSCSADRRRDLLRAVPDHRRYTLRVYDAVGPDQMQMIQIMERFAELNGNKRFRPVYVDYRNFERVLNVASLGNLTRQFVSLLRSEQDADQPAVGYPAVFERLLGPEAKLTRLQALTCKEEVGRRRFPYLSLASWVVRNPRVVVPGTALSFEILENALFGASVEQWKQSSTRQNMRLAFRLAVITGLICGGVQLGVALARYGVPPAG